MIKRILVPVDGSEPADRAVDLAADLAANYGATLVLMHVLAHPGWPIVPPELKERPRSEGAEVTEWDLFRDAATALLDRAEARASSAGAKEILTVIETGDPASRIAEHAREDGIDLVVLGRRGLGDIAGLLLGSVSHKVAQVVPCACMTVK